jgi:hypothetical protein
MPTTMGISGGTKSLTNSPLLLGKTRRGASAMHGNVQYVRDRQSNVYSSQHHGPDTHYAEFGPNHSNQATNHGANFISAPRNRRLSGSQQQEV